MCQGLRCSFSLQGDPFHWLWPWYITIRNGIPTLGASWHRNVGPLGEPQPVLLPMGCSISRAGHVDLKRYYPGSCLHPSPEGLGIQPKHSSPLVGWETQNKIENRDYLIYLFFTVSQPTPQPVPWTRVLFGLLLAWLLGFLRFSSWKRRWKAMNGGKGRLCFKKSM